TFGRAAEYLFFIQQGDSRPSPVELGAEWNPVQRRSKYDLLWNSLIRTGTGPLRVDSPNLFYPVFVKETPEGPAFHSVGDTYRGDAWRLLDPPSDCYAIWPIRRDGTEGRWQVSATGLRQLIAEGSARLGEWRAQNTTVYYLKRGERAKIDSGQFHIVGHRPDGSVITDGSDYVARFVPTDIWRITSHDAGHHGSSILRMVIPGREFPFPKSLYAVEDTLRFFTIDKPNALVLDFFAGSGTTAHAVARLNKQDGGRRKSIMVTNNEVSASLASDLRSRGLRPGDADWEALGIFEHITRPRVTAAITGKTPDGDPIAGDYKFTDEFPMADGFEENAAFLELRYLDADDVDLGLAYDDIAALLWLRAGGRGPIAPRLDPTGLPLPYVWTEQYGVLFDEDRWRAFVADRPDSATAAFIVTYSPTVFAGVAAELPPRMDTVRLYDTYLSLFQPGRGRG
ncbi:MAG TPA: DNA methyltransferase, partial [Candidatus Saccharimonadales bacterium]|nr:DNA methyltransferase [Candidatus Saccharimonadales bacterium]